MQRDMKQYDKEYMKFAMIKQEETFRHQVRELHRLYQTQKLLMREMKNVEMKRQRQNAEINETGSIQPCHSYSGQRQPRRELNLELPAEEYTGKHNGDVMLDADEESDLELTLATGIHRARRKKKDASFTSDSGSSFSSSSNEHNSKEWSLLQVPDISTRFRNYRSSGLDTEEQMRKDGLKQSTWLFQCSKRDMVVSFGL